jgi:hypothetical protein
MTPEESLKFKTIYRYRAYAIQQLNLDGRWRFTHYCPSGLHERWWENNNAPLNKCDVCNEPIPEEIILLWGLIDKEERIEHVKLRNFNPTFNESPR